MNNPSAEQSIGRCGKRCDWLNFDRHQFFEPLIMQPVRRELPVLRCTTALLFIWAILLSSAWGQAPNQHPPLPRQLHPWSSFEPGAWKLVRVITENLNEQGAVTQVSTSDSKTTLLDVDDEGVTLEMAVSVEMAGRRFDTQPQKVKQGFHGEQLTPGLKLNDPTPGEVVIEDRKIPCQVQEIETSNPTGKTVTKIYYSLSVPPYILKRDSITTDMEGKNNLSETTVTVQDLDMPCKILGCLHSSAHVKTLQKTPKGVIITLAVICPEIPGGIISHTSKELDSAGRLIRRSTLELVDFSLEPEKDRTNIFNRKRSTRYRVK
jgi:hypothetical protein